MIPGRSETPMLSNTGADAENLDPGQLDPVKHFRAEASQTKRITGQSKVME